MDRLVMDRHSSNRHIYTYIHEYICIYTHMCVYLHLRIQMYIYAHVHVYIPELYIACICTAKMELRSIFLVSPKTMDPIMEAILGAKMTQHGSYLGGQNDPTWRLSWGSK